MAMLSNEYQYLGRSSAMQSQNGIYDYYLLLYAKAVANGANAGYNIYIKEIIACTADSNWYGYRTGCIGHVNGILAISTSGVNPSKVWSGAITAGGMTYARHIVLAENYVAISDAKSLTVSGSFLFDDIGASNTPLQRATAYIESQISIPQGGEETSLDAFMCSAISMDGLFTLKYTPKKSTYTNKCTISILANGVRQPIKNFLIGQKSAIQQIETFALSADEINTIAHLLPNIDTGTIYAELSTYGDNRETVKQIGATQVQSINLYLPESYIPNFTFSITPINDNEWIASKNIYVKGYSGLTATITDVQPGTGAAIKAKSIFTAEQSTMSDILTIPVLNTGGTMHISSKIIDTRGRNKSIIENINILSYSAPAMAEISQERGIWNDDGTSFTAAEEGQDVRVKGALRISLANYENNGDMLFALNDVAIVPFCGNYTNIANNENFIAGFKNVDGDIAADLKIIVTDKVGSTSNATIIIPPSFVLLEFKANGKGIAFGKASEKDSFECALDANFTGNVTINGSQLNPAADYVIEIGESAASGTLQGWKYRKWASGKMELWAELMNQVSLGVMSASMPFSFSIIENAQASIRYNGAATFWGFPIVQIAANTCNIFLYNYPEKGTTQCVAYVYIIGELAT